MTTNSTEKPRIEPPTALVEKIKALLSNSKVGPTLAAPMVMEIANKWESTYRESMGIACGTWLRAKFGDGASVRFFEVRAAAAKRFGGAKGCVDHCALVWLDSAVKDEMVTPMVTALVTKYNRNQSVPLTLGQTRLIYRLVCGQVPTKPRVCSGCVALQAKVAALEARVGEVNRHR